MNAPFYHHELTAVPCKPCFGRGSFINSTDPRKKLEAVNVACGQCRGKGYVYIETKLIVAKMLRGGS